MSVHLIAGPPGAGKTTYAAAQAGPEGRVIDLDLIAARVGPERAQAVRLAAEAAAANYPGETYVVRNLADGHDRHGVAARIKAKTVTVLAVPPEVAAARLTARDGPAASTTGPAAWWAAYTPHPEDKIIRPTEQRELYGRATVPREAPDKESTMPQTPPTPTPAEIAAAIKPPPAPPSGDDGQQATGGGSPAAPVEKSGATGGNLPRTQEELDRIIGERVSREARKYQGYETYKAAYEQQDARLEQVRAEAADAAARKYGERLARTTVEAAATAAGFHDPADALSHVSLSEVIQGDQVDMSKVEAQLTELATAKPYLVAGNTNTRGPQRLRTNRTPNDPEPPKGRGSASMLAAFARGH